MSTKSGAESGGFDLDPLGAAHIPVELLYFFGRAEDFCERGVFCIAPGGCLVAIGFQRFEDFAD
jgi:hypothetical protein